MAQQRIQRRRSKGWRMPSSAVYVGRPTQWGNPFHVGQPYPEQRTFYGLARPSSLKPVTREQARDLYRDYVAAPVLPRWPGVEDVHRAWLAPLRGRDLVCWCPLDQPCHADVLLDLLK